MRADVQGDSSIFEYLEFLVSNEVCEIFVCRDGYQNGKVMGMVVPGVTF